MHYHKAWSDWAMALLPLAVLWHPVEPQRSASSWRSVAPPAHLKTINSNLNYNHYFDCRSTVGNSIFNISYLYILYCIVIL